MYAKKNSGKKALAMLLAVVLLIGVGVGGTLAWLSATSETVTNTFTVGDIAIELKEYPFKVENGVTSTTVLDETAEPVNSIDTYKVVPGGEQPKKPFVTVNAKSEDCWVYVNVVNNLLIDGDVVVNYDDPNGWTQIATKTADNGAVSTLYRYDTEMKYSETDSDPLFVFTKVTYDDNIVKDKISQLDEQTIVLNAFAHQSANIDVNDADDEAKAHFGYTSTP